jgi:hypothetical protein
MIVVQAMVINVLEFCKVDVMQKGLFCMACTRLRVPHTRNCVVSW